MIRNYPVEKPTSAPATGNMLYKHLVNNAKIPAKANHNIWYRGEKAKLNNPEKYAFRGDIPINMTIELYTISGKPIDCSICNPNAHNVFPYTFNGSEGPILVSDIAENWKKVLGIPENAKPSEKVYNPNFKEYEKLDKYTKWSNELASISFPKSISSFFGGKGKINYSEKDVLNFLDSCFNDLSSPEMMHVLHGNHLAWVALEYIRSDGNVEGGIMTEFHSQNPADFYYKDMGTVLPPMFYALANIGQDPVKYFDKLDLEIYGADDAAVYMRQFMPE